MYIDELNKLGIRLTSITDTIHIIQGRNRSRSPFANAVLILDETIALLDSGCGLDIIERICSVVPIDIVINSHSHPDHTAGNQLIHELSGSEIIVPAESRDTIGDANKLATRLIGPELAKLWIDTSLAFTGYRNFRSSSSFDDGYEFFFGKTRLKALHTPGHIGDHYCLWEAKQKILIGFDIDLSPWGPWYGNPESDIAAFRRSLAKIMSMPVQAYIPSHAKPVKGRYVNKRLSSYQAVFDTREQNILSLIPAGTWVSPPEVVNSSPIYGFDYNKSQNKILMYDETNMVQKHLDQLVEKEKIKAHDGLYRKI